MSEWTSNTTFQVWFVTVFTLFIKMYANSAVQGYYRIRHKAYVRPDDAAFFGGGKAPASADLPIVQRATACWRNDLENIPMFLIIGLAFTLAGGPVTFAMVYFGLFTVARIAHTILYLRPLQPWRNIAYQIGVVMIFVMAIHTAIIIFT